MRSARETVDSGREELQQTVIRTIETNERTLSKLQTANTSVVDAMADGENAVLDPNNFTGIGFADEDDSGTLTDGDIIMVGGNTSVDWTHVRLHSSTAQAYSDENPTLPGFTTVLGVLSLMGAALLEIELAAASLGAYTVILWFVLSF